MENNTNLPEHEIEFEHNEPGRKPEIEQPPVRGSQIGFGKRASIQPRSPINDEPVQQILTEQPTFIGKMWGTLGYVTSLVTPSWMSSTAKADAVAIKGPLAKKELTPQQVIELKERARELGISEPKIDKATENNTLGKVVRLQENTLKHYNSIIKNYEIQAEGRLALHTGEQTTLTANLLLRVIKSALKHDISGTGKIVKKDDRVFLTQRLKGRVLEITENSRLKALGGGAFGVVYKELNVTRGEHVALKVAKADEGVSHSQAVKALHREGNNLKIVNGGRKHTLGVQPPALAFYPITVSKAKKRPGMAIPLFSTTLLKLIDSPDVGLAQRMTYVQQLFSGLVSVHAAKMVHRDIKPDNIGVNDGEAYLADFGEAESTDGMLGNGLFSGLVKWSWVAIESFLLDAGPGYQEQLWHPQNDHSEAQESLLTLNPKEAREILEKSDVHALGKVAYCLLARTQQWDENFDARLLAKQDVPNEVIQILERTQDTNNPLNRPSALEVLAVIEKLNG